MQLQNLLLRHKAVSGPAAAPRATSAPLTRASSATLEAPATPAGSRCPFSGTALFTRITETPAKKCPFGGDENFSVKDTDYQPWKGEKPFKLTTGLEPLQDKEDLFEIDEFFHEELEERRQLLQRMRSEVFASSPEACSANQELLEIMADMLPRRYPDRYQRDGDFIHNMATGETFSISDSVQDPLETASLLVQEDLALLLPDERSKQYKLVSAAVLFPMRWSLIQKMNRRLNVIHGPVPFYQKELRHPVDEFMNALTPEQPFWRANFGITDNPALFQALTEKQIFEAKNDKLQTVQKGHITVEDASHRLFVRCERQTLSRLPKSGAVLFTIRTYVRPMSEYLGKPRETLQRLRDSVEGMPDIWVNYKTMQGCRDVALELLDKQLETTTA